MGNKMRESYNAIMREWGSEKEKDCRNFFNLKIWGLIGGFLPQ